MTPAAETAARPRARRRYAIVSPVRNEAALIERTLESVTSQTEPPVAWIVVDDGSTDATPSLVGDYVWRYPYVRLLRLGGSNAGDSPDRLLWAAEAIAFNRGLAELDLDDVDFIVKLDGDLAFDEGYFSALLDEFERDVNLGMAGGYCYQVTGGRRELEWNPPTHVRGPVKMYRVACFREIGGIEPVYAWDALDELKAQMAGWHTRSFDLVVDHLKATGTVGGLLHARARMGLGAYLLGYHPLFLLARAARLSLGRPRVIGGLAFLGGYARAALRRPARITDERTRAYLRRQQLDRLRGLAGSGEVGSLLGGDAS